MNQKIYQSETSTSQNFIVGRKENEVIFYVLKNANPILTFGHCISHNCSHETICKKLTSFEKGNFGVSSMARWIDESIIF
jgi:hypothetical protein